MLTAGPFTSAIERNHMLRKKFISSAITLFIFLFSTSLLCAQNPAPVLTADNPAQPVKLQEAQTGFPDAVRGADQIYRVGPGDLLDIRIFNHPELSGERRINEAGRIRLPFIEELQAACLTEAEIASQITEKYKKFLRFPQVDVLVKEYKSLPVAVIGSVNQPARFQLQRRVRLLELLTYVGGPSNRAGKIVHVIHSNDYDFCQVNQALNQQTAAQNSANVETENPEGGTISITTALSTVNLYDVLSGKLDANLYIQPGDIVSIPEADQIYVTGAVNRPGPYALTTKLTLTQAVAMAGGVNTEGAKNRIRLIRQDGESDKRTEVVYNLEDINKRKIKDIDLLPNDIIEVPNSTMRLAARNLLGVSINMLNTLPFFILR